MPYSAGGRESSPGGDCFSTSHMRTPLRAPGDGSTVEHMTYRRIAMAAA